VKQNHTDLTKMPEIETRFCKININKSLLQITLSDMLLANRRQEFRPLEMKETLISETN
jgi:hypothetical protein